MSSKLAPSLALTYDDGSRRVENSTPTVQMVTQPSLYLEAVVLTRLAPGNGNPIGGLVFVRSRVWWNRSCR